MPRKKQETKTCRICNETKQISKFEKDKRVTGQRTTRCQSCKYRSQDRATYAYRKLHERAKAEPGRKVEVTLAQVKALFAAFDGRCAYCNREEEPNGPYHHLEHIIAKSAGGRDHISNLTISCKDCNMKKGTKPVVDYFYAKEQFQDENFAQLAYYVAFTSDQPVSEVLREMVDAHIEQCRRNIERGQSS